MATEHVNGNGTEEPMDTSAAVTHSEHFQTLIEAGLPQKVAEKLDEIYIAGLVAHSDLDERAIEALKEFNEEGALHVLVQFKESDLSHVQNKSAFLCGVMKTYRQREKQGTKVSDSNKGPDEVKIKIFVGKIPRDLFEDELVPLFEKAGPIWDLRLMMDPLSGLNRGYAFVTFCTKEAAQEAVKLVKVLFVRNLANSVTEEILEKAFSQFGKLERVKKLKDYAFIHFDERDGAVKALEEMNGKDLEGENIEIVFAKPPDQKRKERKAQRQAAKTQMYDDYYYYGPPHMPPPTRGRGRGGARGGYSYPPDYYGYEDYYDYYGYDYHNYRGGYDDPYFGYEDFQPPAPRGGRGGVRGGPRGGASPVRGRGGAGPPRGRAGFPQRGGGGAVRGPRGGGIGRGGPAVRVRGVRGARGGRGGNIGGKRKADGYSQPDSKRRQTNNQNWGSQPIAQQPLQGGDHSGNYGYKSDNQEFYQDSFGQQWK
uniref:RRM domain-containing protein n=1 Tax=Pygocentrus nattereri TaxID=42514 RepID=A0AAR2KFQ8_PYGNA